jgi:hypothetical protein
MMIQNAGPFRRSRERMDRICCQQLSRYFFDPRGVCSFCDTVASGNGYRMCRGPFSLDGPVLNLLP